MRRPIVFLLVLLIAVAIRTIFLVEDEPMAATEAATFLGRRAMVVGATSGIGEGIALRLAELGFSVTAVGRSVERGEAVVDKMNVISQAFHHSHSPSSSSSSTETRPDHRFLSCDGSLIRNMEVLARNYSAGQDPPSLDVLIITQGIGSMDGRTETIEGIDRKLATHYYARIALINSLLPALSHSQTAESASSSPWTGAKVLSVLAAGIHPPYKEYREDPELRTHYSVKNAADAATFYNDMAMDSLARQNPSITFFHANPGFVNTNWGTEMPWYVRWPIRAIQPLGKSPKDYARVICQAVLHNPPDGSLSPPNFRLLDEKGRPTVTTSLHEEAREFVWEHTLATIQAATESQ